MSINTDNLLIIFVPNTAPNDLLKKYFTGVDGFGIPSDNFTVGDLKKFNPRIDIIILTKNAPWNDVTTCWHIDCRCPSVLTMRSRGTTELGPREISVISKFVRLTPGMEQQSISMGSKVALWWSTYLNLNGSSTPLNSTLYQVNHNTMVTDTTTSSKPKFTWSSANARTITIIPAEARSVKLSGKEALCFITKEGYTISYTIDSLKQFASIDTSRPYVWIGIPPNTLYLSSQVNYIYKFSAISKNYYRSFIENTILMPRNYQMIRNGAVIELIYSQETKTHSPSLADGGVLILGQS